MQINLEMIRTHQPRFTIPRPFKFDHCFNW